jgi:hypothetical protein
VTSSFFGNDHRRKKSDTHHRAPEQGTRKRLFHLHHSFLVFDLLGWSRSDRCHDSCAIVVPRSNHSKVELRLHTPEEGYSSSGSCRLGIPLAAPPPIGPIDDRNGDRPGLLLSVRLSFPSWFSPPRYLCFAMAGYACSSSRVLVALTFIPTCPGGVADGKRALPCQPAPRKIVGERFTQKAPAVRLLGDRGLSLMGPRIIFVMTDCKFMS